MDGFSSYLVNTFTRPDLKCRLSDIHKTHHVGMAGITPRGAFSIDIFQSICKRLICNQVAFGQLSLADLNDAV